MGCYKRNTVVKNSASWPVFYFKFRTCFNQVGLTTTSYEQLKKICAPGMLLDRLRKWG